MWKVQLGLSLLVLVETFIIGFWLSDNFQSYITTVQLLLSFVIIFLVYRYYSILKKEDLPEFIVQNARGPHLKLTEQAVNALIKTQAFKSYQDSRFNKANKLKQDSAAVTDQFLEELKNKEDQIFSD